jgi:hypothetical protein
MFDRGMKRLDVWDLGLTKFVVAFLVLAVISGSATVRRRVQSQNPRLLFIVALILAVRPMYRFFR